MQDDPLIPLEFGKNKEMTQAIKQGYERSLQEQADDPPLQKETPGDPMTAAINALERQSQRQHEFTLHLVDQMSRGLMTMVEAQPAGHKPRFLAKVAKDGRISVPQEVRDVTGAHPGLIVELEIVQVQNPILKPGRNAGKRQKG